MGFLFFAIIITPIVCLDPIVFVTVVLVAHFFPVLCWFLWKGFVEAVGTTLRDSMLIVNRQAKQAGMAVGLRGQLRE